MTISLHEGDLLSASDVDAIVNTVNCVGVMGKGIALQFKKKWPGNFKAYSEACKNKEVVIGKMLTYDLGSLATPKYIINFPTKQHWRSPSKIKDIQVGLIDLLITVEKYDIQSIAIPPLGCGNGGLDWDEVLPLIIKTFENHPHLDVRIYPPTNQPNADTISANTNTTRPKMTEGRAALLLLLDGYREVGYGLSRIETQKLVYFLQETGFNLNLEFVKYEYGPYADKLRHVLDRIDGHFIKGVGDGVVASEIKPIPEALDEARSFVENYSPNLLSHIEQVKDLIDGYESLYGLELLSTVHWVTKHENILSWEDAVTHVHKWNNRKQTMQPMHIKTAWNKLKSSRFIAN
ncbi:macro domain protein [Acinetobacter sp. WC-323]|uniref:type II toxin-antitoxin system antitoxin DNA ADP-ribosyl glycohydrolase DarG n=1 Tax=Acinetobacter sp. WC-323 TaxID=903918 RepID=UPI00029DEDF8|nr:macro domain-containing protein [Acinetobacter sp. WC-323]EKU51418.1 macro domain protein [Acinetobacter sp. WC-323]